jgi:hypothetical protein
LVLFNLPFYIQSNLPLVTDIPVRSWHEVLQLKLRFAVYVLRERLREKSRKTYTADYKRSIPQKDGASTTSMCSDLMVDDRSVLKT